MQHLQAAQSNDPSREASLTDLLLTIEKKYQSQIAELRETHSKFLQVKILRTIKKKKRKIRS